MNAQQNRVNLVATLIATAGEESVLTDPASKEFYSHDVYRKGQEPVAILRPTSVDALSQALASLSTQGATIVPRGGGMSYTDGYLAIDQQTVLLDLTKLDQVIEVNVEDGYVTVECGCTWKALAETLAESGVRTPYWGPLSGMKATIGGALSQGSIFLGSGQYGSAADNVLSMDVLSVDGQLIRTGSRVNTFAAPFYRYYGPDLTGLFTGDCGALGVKVRATLPLKSLPVASRYASFSYRSAKDLLESMADIARADLVSECFAFDPGLQNQRLKRSSLLEDVKSLKRVVSSASSTLAGIKEGIKIASAGRRFLKDGDFSMHLSLDGRSDRDAEEKLKLVSAIGSKRGKQVENTIPKVMRADPFANVNSMLGPGGERWVPVHGIVPFSSAVSLFEACEKVFEEHQARLDEFDIDTGVLMCTVGTSASLIEPCLYWPDSRPPFQQAVLDDDYLSKLPEFPANPESREAIKTLRSALTDIMHRHGATHFQIGKHYPYDKDADPGARALLEAIKAHLDSAGHMNPGALGLVR